MRHNTMHLVARAVAVAACIVSGCGSPSDSQYVPLDTATKGTGPDPADIRTVAQRMARELVGTVHLVQAAVPPRIAMLPVKNRTRFLIDGEILIVQIQDHMNEFQPGKFAFVARDRLPAIEAERELKRSGEADSSKTTPLAGVDFFLTGEMRGIGQAGPGVQSDYVMFHFELIDAETGIKAWTGNYEVRKVGQWSDVYP